MTDKQAEVRALAAMLRNDKAMFIDEVADKYEAAANLLESLHARVVELEEINQQLSEQYDTAANCVKDLQSQLARKVGLADYLMQKDAVIVTRKTYEAMRGLATLRKVDA